MNVAIVKYNAGNICSVANCLKRLGVEPLLTDNAEELMRADRVLLPGQGEAGCAMGYLRRHGLDRVICDLRQPVLGICIGQQLMCRHSDEGDVDCLGIFNACARRFEPERHEDKVPAMGWNSLYNLATPLFNGFGNKEYMYFIHSYYVPVCSETIATTDYILPYSAAMNIRNFYATQFHPEKSGEAGSRIIQNFLSIKDND